MPGSGRGIAGPALFRIACGRVQALYRDARQASSQQSAPRREPDVLQIATQMAADVALPGTHSPFLPRVRAMHFEEIGAYS